MPNISYDIIRKIFYIMDTHTQLLMKQTCKQLNAFEILYINGIVGANLNNELLCHYSHIYELTINFNIQITDNALKYLPLLTSLDASYTKITDEGLKYLPLLTSLDVSYTKITDEGLKYVPLLTSLDASYTNITDEGLKYVPSLTSLNASCTNITNKGLKHLPLLHTLNAIETRNG